MFQTDPIKVKRHIIWANPSSFFYPTVLLVETWCVDTPVWECAVLTRVQSRLCSSHACSIVSVHITPRSPPHVQNISETEQDRIFENVLRFCKVINRMQNELAIRVCIRFLNNRFQRVVLLSCTCMLTDDVDFFVPVSKTEFASIHNTCRQQGFACGELNSLL